MRLEIQAMKSLGGNCGADNLFFFFGLLAAVENTSSLHSLEISLSIIVLVEVDIVVSPGLVDEVVPSSRNTA